MPTSFDSLDHQIMIDTLAENIHDNRFLRLIDGMLKAGYLEDWRWNATLSGMPQGGIASPIMSNIYLDRLDKFVETQLIPQYHRGQRRRENSDYEQISGFSQQSWEAVLLRKPGRHAGLG
jgi:retron-type reverse transcriptase